MNTAVQSVPENGQAYKKCRITIVTPGSSDAVIDVWPAEHEKEKIWLDNTPGIERWDVIQRMLNNFAERGTRVPKPAKWHNDGKFNKPDLEEADIPLVRLDGAVLKAPPKEEVVPIKTPVDQRDVDARFQAVNAKVDNLAQAISNLTTAIQEQKKVGVTESVLPKCDVCGKSAKNRAGVAAHKRIAHKEI